MKMKEINVELEPIEVQLDFWKSFVEGMSKALHETQKAYRLKHNENKLLKEQLDVAREALEAIGDNRISCYETRAREALEKIQRREENDEP
jgi:hypothetical protein